VNSLLLNIHNDNKIQPSSHHVAQHAAEWGSGFSNGSSLIALLNGKYERILRADSHIPFHRLFRELAVPYQQAEE
jgi:hypothetical protein